MFSQVLCIAFDAVGTLIYPDPPVPEVYAGAARKFGVNDPAETIHQRFLDAFREEFPPGRPTNEDRERATWRRVVERTIGIQDIEPCFEELFAHFGKAESWRCFEDVGPVLTELAARGYDLVLASNFDRRLHTICEGHEELMRFSRRVISSEVGMPKPAPGFFQALMEISGHTEGELLMVGDDWINDIWGAREMGIGAIYLDRTQEGPLSVKDGVTVISSLVPLLEILS